MAVITKLTEEEVSDVVGQFEVGKFWNYKYMKGGQANTNYSVVTTKGEFVLTICDEKSEAEVHQRAILLDRLLESGVPVPQVIPSITGRSYVLFNNKPIIIKSFIEGMHSKAMTNLQLTQLGETLAKIHLSAIPNSLPMKSPYDLKGLKSVYEVEDDFARWVVDKAKYLRNNIPKNVPKGLIHGDLFWDNVLFHGEKLSAIIDFEEACHFDLTYDIAMTLIGNCFSKGKIDVEKSRCILKAYETHRKLEKEEKDHFNYFLSYAASAAAYWRFRQFNVYYPQLSKKNAHKEMMEIADYYEGSYAKAYTDILFTYH